MCVLWSQFLSFFFTQTLSFDKTLNCIKVHPPSFYKSAFQYLSKVSNWTSNKTSADEIREIVMEIKCPKHEWVDDVG